MQEITSKELAARGIGKYTHISDAFTFNLPKPKSINELYGSFNNTSINLPSNFVFEISNAFVVGEIGMVVYENYLVIDTAIRKEFLPACRKIITADPTVVSLAHLWAYGNYFHWLLNVMSRICLLKETNKFNKENVFIVNSCDKKYEQEGYAMMGIERVIPVFNSWWKCKNIILPSPMSDDAVINPRGCRFLRDELTVKCQGDSFPHKICIRRKNGRTITNDNEVYRCLKENGFEEVYCEDYSFSDQIRMFSNAELIVAPHGAGLANIVFCSPQTKVLEILSPIYLNSCFRRLAAYSELDYYFMLGEGEISLEEHRDAPITVNINNLKKSLSLLL